MKIIIILLFPFVFFSCDQRSGEIKQMQAKIDSLQKELAATYKPGFGEFMSGIQVHHAKLWFAGLYQNWALADFEMHEIKESLEAIRTYCSDRPEMKEIGMIDTAMNNVNNAIQQKDLSQFKNNFIALTNACNKCHYATEHKFNVVAVPSALPVVNQDFKPAH